MNLLKNVKFYCPGDAVSAGASIDDDSAYVDTAGFDGILFVTTITDSVATGVAKMIAEQCDTTGGTYAALSGGTATATSATNDDLNTKLLIVDVYRPQERYLRVNRTSATANIAYGPVTAVLYNGRLGPITQSTTEVANSVQAISPAEA